MYRREEKYKKIQNYHPTNGPSKRTNSAPRWDVRDIFILLSSSLSSSSIGILVIPQELIEISRILYCNVEYSLDNLHDYTLLYNYSNGEPLEFTRHRRLENREFHE